MKTTDKILRSPSPRYVSHVASGGRTMPARPVLQRTTYESGNVFQKSPATPAHRQEVVAAPNTTIGSPGDVRVISAFTLQKKDTFSTQSEGNDPAREGIVQRVLHKGLTTKSKIYSKATKLGKYSSSEVREYIDSPKHYRYDSERDEMVVIEESTKKRKREKKDTGSSSEDFEFKEGSWMKQVDSGVEEYNKTGGMKVKFKGRELKDKKNRGFKVGTNNIANIEGLKDVDKLNLSKERKALVFLANHLKDEIVEDSYLADVEKDEDKKEKKKERIKNNKKKFGPELQQIVGSNKDGLHLIYSGNTKDSNEMIEKELQRSKHENKKRKLIDYHKDNYRSKTIKEATEQMQNCLDENSSLEEEIKQSISQFKPKSIDDKDEKTSKLLKEKIGDKYKNKNLKYLYKLRNSLKIKYKNEKLENANIVILPNEKEIHAESNSLNRTIKEYEYLDVIGTKVPCVACFTKFCLENKQQHLLQYTSSIWFSNPCMTQLGCDFSKQNPEEVVKYLKVMDQGLKNALNNIERYTGHEGDIKNDFDDEDSDSMGEESRQEIIKKYRGN